ncbi:hypothetical protein MHBO_003628 [Bonamia ostreae]|uniref:Uncharacterized protein n=1 Tax=Bonamia ostreae TaxID=126728 RepID=A0ABV2AR03_9EUKA
MASESQKISQGYQKLIIDVLKEKGGSCSYEELVKEAEKQHCDSLGAMLKILKNKNVITFSQVFLMYPMHKDEIVTLLSSDFDPFNDK